MSRIETTEAIDETNAAIGAAIATCSMPTQFETLLTELQHELLELTETIEHDRPAPSADRLQQALQQHPIDTSTRSCTILGGASDAAGLLKLARIISRRARRLATPLNTDAGRYLELLAKVLLAVALHTEEQEHARYDIGSCTGDVVRPTVRPC